jgi:hypothetical protein
MSKENDLKKVKDADDTIKIIVTINKLIDVLDPSTENFMKTLLRYTIGYHDRILGNHGRPYLHQIVDEYFDEYLIQKQAEEPDLLE